MNISISGIRLFKACRRAYYFRYIENLEPTVKSDALETGSNYHELIEELYRDGEFTQSYSKECAMATAYKKYIYPKFKVTAVEEWRTHGIGSDLNLIGRVDGLAEDNCLVEHKSTSAEITEAYEYDLLWDEQILTYMFLTGTRKVWYTVCRKPTIRQCKNETDEEFFNRMVEWYDTDTDKKIRLLEIYRTDEEVEQFGKELRSIASLMSVVSNGDERQFYRNTCHCNKWGRRCEYSSICLNYDPNQEYVEFVKGERDEPTKN